MDNPHTHVWVDVKDDSGKVVNWTLEGYPPNVLERTGWKKDVTIKVGDTLTFFGWRARDGSPFAHLREATLASGQEAVLRATGRHGRRSGKPSPLRASIHEAHACG